MKKGSTSHVAKENVVQNDQKKKSKTDKGTKLQPRGGISKKPKFQPKFQGKCYNCNKMGHRSSKYRLPKKTQEANVVDDITQDMSEINLSAMVS